MPIRIRNFGSLYPKHSARALPDNGAQVALNIEPNSTEFRPMPTDLTVVADSGLTDPQTLFRFQRNSDGTLNTGYSNLANWRVYASDRSIVKMPSNDDATDRHVMSFNDGSAEPRVIDATGGDRQLGVPAPTVAPTVSIEVVDEFTVEERGPALAQVRAKCVDIIRNNAHPLWVGATHPGTTTSGFVDFTTTRGFPNDEPSLLVRSYRLASEDGAVTNAYSDVTDADFSWIFDPALAPFKGQAVSGLSWATAGQWHACLAFVGYGRIYQIDEASMTTQLAAIEMPGTDDGTKLLTAPQVSELVDRTVAFCDPDSPTLKPKIDALVTAVDRAKLLLNGGARASIVATRQAFYDKADVAAAIATAKENAAKSIYAMACAVAQSALPPEYGGSGAGSFDGV